jgi:hypothetical protein
VEQRKPWLRYVDADDIADETLELDGMKVRNDAGDKLGEVDGLIVDATSGRTYYVVVDAGGWFKTKYFLMPIGQLRLDDDRDALVVNLTKDRINAFPGFDRDHFDRLSDAEIASLNRDTIRVLEPDVPFADAEPFDAAWTRPSYREPEWWIGEPSMARRQAVSSHRQQSTEDMRAVANDVSPHQDGRAQPGDVLGVETGGERTHIGETTEDENKRRQDAEKSTRKR